MTIKKLKPLSCDSKFISNFILPDESNFTDLISKIEKFHKALKYKNDKCGMYVGGVRHYRLSDVFNES